MRRRRDRERQLLSAHVERPRCREDADLAQLREDRVQALVDENLPVHESRRRLVHNPERGEHRLAGEARAEAYVAVERLSRVVCEMRQREERRRVVKSGSSWSSAFSCSPARM